MPADSYPKVERTAWGTGNGLFIDLAEVPQGFVGHNLVGVDEAKPSCGRTLGFSEVEELFTLPNVNGNLTPLGAMLLILMALILGMILDSELLQGGMQDFGKTLHVQAVGTNPGSCHLERWLQGRLSEKLAQGKAKRAKVCRVVIPIAKSGSAYKRGVLSGLVWFTRVPA